ncbi:conserved hypothetical protein [Solidesulfovibrio fructosivorans JJ]]|uniref:Type II secretion system protein GspE N-terminal domain-containing protein n=1 Tax=Solidesulfovibrio fructosivorans JJ] TaxID=596151 RepID=E1JS39_SOLFR|nr:hypothetical protein [Solidesulfovibrio fructosivorans]EFL52808.1 conserved hypothetical protein [Solidesulfovibrio fructosivorans JJ]]
MNFLGRFLVEQGAISEEQLADGLRFQKEHNRRIGEMAVDRGVLSPGEVNGICRRQRADPRLFGDIAVEERRLSRKDLDQLLFFQKVHHTYLGEALLLRGHIDREQYKRLLGRHFALRQSGQVSLRYIQDFFADNKAAELLVMATERVMRRFAGLTLEVAALGQPEDMAVYPETGRITGILSGRRRLCAAIGLSAPLAAGLCREAGATAAENPLDAFFTCVLVFFQDMLRDASLLSHEMRMTRDGAFFHPREESLGIRCDTPAGKAAFAIWIEETPS